jgi:CHAT domain-containing protein
MQTTAEAAQLGQMLLGRAASLLGTKRLVIIGDGVLQYIPFAALQEPEIFEQQEANNSGQVMGHNHAFKPLMLNHEILYLPSISALALIRQENKSRKIAPLAREVAIIADPVFGSDDDRVSTSSPSQLPRPTEKKKPSMSTHNKANISARQVGLGDTIPPLMFSHEEAEKIYELAQSKGGGMLAEGFKANRRVATDPELARHYRIIHFSTHALLNNEHPNLSGIVLSLVDEHGESQDGFLQLYEIYNLKMPVDLVVLSACQTALGKNVRGEGIIGLTRGFMYAGASRVAATLWEVDDQATAELMTRFYEKMLGNERLPPAAALRKAQISMWQQKTRMGNPFYWAGFIVQGEWKPMRSNRN